MQLKPKKQFAKKSSSLAFGFQRGFIMYIKWIKVMVTLHGKWNKKGFGNNDKYNILKPLFRGKSQSRRYKKIPYH